MDDLQTEMRHHVCVANDTPERHLVKRYSLARLYDTSTQAYVDVAQLRELIR